MTCRGYDPKTIKVNKTVKRMAALIMDPHTRGAYIREYVVAIKQQARSVRPKETSSE